MIEITPKHSVSIHSIFDGSLRSRNHPVKKWDINTSVVHDDNKMTVRSNDSTVQFLRDSQSLTIIKAVANEMSSGRHVLGIKRRRGRPYRWRAALDSGQSNGPFSIQHPPDLVPVVLGYQSSDWITKSVSNVVARKNNDITRRRVVNLGLNDTR